MTTTCRATYCGNACENPSALNCAEETGNPRPTWLSGQAYAILLRSIPASQCSFERSNSSQVNFAARVRGLTAEHRGQRRLHSECRLVVELSARDAADERLLLLRVRLRQVVREGPSRRELAFCRWFVASAKDPLLVSPDAQRSCVGRLRRSLRFRRSARSRRTATLPNCVELKLTSTLLGYWNTTSKCE